MSDCPFTDPLLVKWWPMLECSELRDYFLLLEWAIRDWDVVRSPLLTLSQVDAWIIYERIGERGDDLVWNNDMGKLGKLIRAELSGARRAREKIEEERMGCAEGDTCSNCRALGRVLEAFDGE